MAESGREGSWEKTEGHRKLTQGMIMVSSYTTCTEAGSGPDGPDGKEYVLDADRK